MSLKFRLSGQQIKHLKTSLQCLCKIGSELLMEASPEKVALRSINSAKSAAFEVAFMSRFFDSFEIFSTRCLQTAVQLKHVLASFRTARVRDMEFIVDTATSQLSVRVTSENELVKCYRIELVAADIMVATLDRTAFPVRLVAEVGELSRLLASFQHSLDEILVIANPESGQSVVNANKAVQLQSFHDPNKPRKQGSLYTSLSVDTRSVFLQYSHAGDSPLDVCFNVKDFKVMVALCEAMQANVEIRFDRCGVPLVAEPHFSSMEGAAFKAELVLATLTESQLGSQQQAAWRQQQQQAAAADGGPGGGRGAAEPAAAAAAAGAAPAGGTRGRASGARIMRFNAPLPEEDTGFEADDVQDEEAEEAQLMRQAGLDSQMLQDNDPEQLPAARSPLLQRQQQRQQQQDPAWQIDSPQGGSHQQQHNQQQQQQQQFLPQQPQQQYHGSGSQQQGWDQQRQHQQQQQHQRQHYPQHPGGQQQTWGQPPPQQQHFAGAGHNASGGPYWGGGGGPPATASAAATAGVMPLFQGHPPHGMAMEHHHPGSVPAVYDQGAGSVAYSDHGPSTGLGLTGVPGEAAGFQDGEDAFDEEFPSTPDQDLGLSNLGPGAIGR